MSTSAPTELPNAPRTSRTRSTRRRAPLTARGEPMVWFTGGCVALAVLMIAVLMLFIFWQGASTFWPRPLVQLKTRDGKVLMGEPSRQEAYPVSGAKPGTRATRVLYKTGNFDLTGADFTWVDDSAVVETTLPKWGLVIERQEWFNAYGTLEGIEIDGKRIDDPEKAWEKFNEIRGSAATMIHARLIVRTSENKIVPADRSKPDEPMLVSQVVRAYPANQLDFPGKTRVYFSRWWEYLWDNPREANAAGGVFPAIVGTVLLTFIMILFVVPLGVIAAIYLREYARQGLLVTIVRISVNNLAGVPSIVFGVFGLGFFCYLVGGSIDRTFFPGQGPVIGKTALLWASLTLALLTLPVVIVATEEALSAVPRSMREGAYGCGASKWQVIRRIILPRAMPGIMTGMILAIARGAGEVAPIMLVGAVKDAKELPINFHPPFFGTNGSFMHLGFHIYDLAFQSRNSEAARPMVFMTTLLLISIVVILNVSAMILRSRLRRAYATGKF